MDNGFFFRQINYMRNFIWRIYNFKNGLTCFYLLEDPKNCLP